MSIELPPISSTPIGVISITISTAFVPIVAKLFSMGARLVKRITVVEGKLRDRTKDLDRLCDAHDSNVPRLLKMEEAIESIRKVMERNDEQYVAIMNELKQLPRCMALMEAHAKSLDGVVPRHEVDLLLRNVEARMSRIEADVREGRAH